MHSGFLSVNKIKPDSLLEVQTFNNHQFLQSRPLFEVLYREEKPGDFSLLKNDRTETWCIRTDKSYCMGEYLPKAF